MRRIDLAKSGADTDRGPAGIARPDGPDAEDVRAEERSGQPDRSAHRRHTWLYEDLLA